jgi:hypothetical protein
MIYVSLAFEERNMRKLPLSDSAVGEMGTNHIIGPSEVHPLHVAGRVNILRNHKKPSPNKITNISLNSFIYLFPTQTERS